MDGFDKLKKNYQVAEANSRMYAQEVEETKAKCNSDTAHSFKPRFALPQQEVGSRG